MSAAVAYLSLDDLGPHLMPCSMAPSIACVVKALGGPDAPPPGPVTFALATQFSSSVTVSEFGGTVNVIFDQFTPPRRDVTMRQLVRDFADWKIGPPGPDKAGFEAARDWSEGQRGVTGVVPVRGDRGQLLADMTMNGQVHFQVFKY